MGREEGKGAAAEEIEKGGNAKREGKDEWKWEMKSEGAIHNKNSQRAEVKVQKNIVWCA